MTILKVLSFLYNVYEVNTSISYLLVIGDAETFELLCKLKDEYGQDLECLNFLPLRLAHFEEFSVSCFQNIWP